jgi:small-conductance mechanosensitive channel
VRTVHRVILSVFTLGVIVQFFLAGLGVFRVQDGASSSRFDHVFEPHRVLGNVLLIVALLVLVAALIGRLGRGQALLGLVLTLLVFLQSVLANAGPSWVRAIHPVVAVLILALAGSFTGRLWREQRAGLS